MAGPSSRRKPAQKTGDDLILDDNVADDAAKSQTASDMDDVRSRFSGFSDTASDTGPEATGEGEAAITDGQAETTMSSVVEVKKEVSSSDQTISYDAVTDGHTDIAMTSDGEKMKVEAIGRMPLQKVYLWAGSNAGTTSSGKRKASTSFTTNKAYSVREDGPDAGLSPDRLPTHKEESTPHALAVEYLEVGLIIGNEPDRYKKRGQSRDKAREKEREARGEANRDKSAMRVYTPVTPYIATQAKYYVGVKPSGGRYWPRVIQTDFIYFYAEFWHGLPPAANKVAKMAFVNGRTKYHAAKNKSATDRSTTAITVDQMEKWATSNPLAVTQSENLASTLALLYTLFDQTGDRSYVRSIIKVMEDAAPDLKVGPYAAIDGVNAFYDFYEKLNDVDAQRVVNELKKAMPAMPDLNIALVEAVHGILMRKGWGDRLPYSDLAFFLELCNHHIPSTAFDDEVIEGEVDRVLEVVKIHNKHKVARTTSDIDSISKDDYLLVLNAVKDVIHSIDTHIQDSGKALASQHGGILRHTGIKDLMNKLGNAVDVVTLQSYWEQLGVLHAVQYANSNRQASEKLQALNGLIDRVLSARQ